jgi:hypothetical protein
MRLSESIAAISWDPQIRGALVVATMVAILMGSVYLILATNLAKRLGFLVAITGFFAWMTLLGITWWVYGQGWLGDAATWEVEEINTGQLDGAELEEAHRLEDAELPNYEELNELTPEEFEEVAAGLEDDLGGWLLLSESDPVRGEAQAVVDAALQGPDYPTFALPEDYVVQYGMEFGGKPEADDDDILDIIGNRITNTLRVTHPPKYAIVMVQPGEFAEPPIPGEPPPEVVPAEGADVVSVVMVRNLGSLRLPAAMTTIVSFVLFLTCCYMLHVRDKTVMANRAAPLPEAPAPGSAPVKVGSSS